MNDFNHSVPNPSVCVKLQTAALVCGGIVAALGGVALIGWIAGIESLRGGFAAGITMKTNTAIGLILLGIALLLTARTHASSWPGRFGRVLAGIPVLIGSATLFQHATGVDLGIDQALFREAAGAIATTSPNRMGIPSSTAMPLVGLAIIFLGARARGNVVPSQAFAALTILIMLFPLVGYILNMPSLYGIAVTGIAFSTAIAFALAAVGVLCARPTQGMMRRVVADDGGGIVVRRLLPAAIILPVLLGWLRQTGQDAGLYDANFGRILSMVLFIVVFSTLTLWTGKVISLHARARARAEAAESEMKDRLLKTLESERSARTAAEQSSRMKDEFLATLSHELRTPLQAIVGWAHVLSRTGLAPEDQKLGVETIERNARLQTQLIEDLLDMSRIVSGKIRLEVDDVDLARVVEAALDAVRPAAQAKNLTIGSRLEEQPAIVRGESARLQQVVWNLLSNAIKFTEAGGRIEVGLARVDSYFDVCVRDTGIGIRPDLLGQIFERFSQADSSTTRQFGGLGLGLSIARQLTELHGGMIVAESAGEGRGSAFTLRIPVGAALRETLPEGTDDGAELATATVDLAGLRMLVVDDQSDARELIARILRDRKAEVWTAQDVASALALLARERFDVLISDIGMPGRDGYDLIREVRSKGLTLPAIALTAFARAEEKKRALDAGYQTHLAKPVDPAQLARAIARVQAPSSIETS
jgi:signal transduction histidine kinase/ActR/RegA family two-component response regulator